MPSHQGAGSWWQMSLALVPRKVKPSELDEDDWCWCRYTCGIKNGWVCSLEWF